jgi:5-methylcytosine-specific restriction enzyme A
MPNKPASYRPPGLHKRQPDPRASAAERGYDRRWRKARLSFLADHPCCVTCVERGLVAEATVVDHVIPHRGDAQLFDDQSNWQALCTECHNRKTATEDMRGAT